MSRKMLRVKHNDKGREEERRNRERDASRDRSDDPQPITTDDERGDLSR